MSSLSTWQYDTPVKRPLITAPFLFFSSLAVLGVLLSAKRLIGGLAFTGMNDDFAWGVWKTFNVMTLTALGSSALAMGIVVWLFDRRQLHSVMRTALVSSILFYATGMFALGFDVGRPWNFYNILFIWRWNPHSALLEVAVCMTAYVAIFLLYENLPTFIPAKWFNRIKPVYPFMVAFAFVLPAMHQSSLGTLMVIGGPKVHALWQTQMLPFFYLMQAIICGFASLIVILMVSCLAWRRPLDVPVLSTIAKYMAWVSLAFIVLRYVDLGIRGAIGLSFEATKYSAMFYAENLLLLVPALILLNERLRRTPRVIFITSILIALGGVMYRFSPTTFAFRAGGNSLYFPTVAELLMCVGYISLAIALFIFAATRFAILPDQLKD
jgi:Ni/Fe-hydrogenase subunit HybB-like protein